jgi:sigma-B regulation protein RsbU (phosphoserine phosphatase)
MSAATILYGKRIMTWEERLAHVTATMREISRQTDPQEMTRAYGQRMRALLPIDRMVSVSRRGLAAPRYRVTRCSLWKEEINPWKQPDRLPLLEGGLLAELLYGDQPRILHDVQVDPSDPAAEYLDGQRSLLAVPLYDQGHALNMVLFMRREPGAFHEDGFPEVVWMSNLFGRATNNLVLSDRLREAYEAADHEMKVIGDIQRGLLPRSMPRIPNLGVAAYYQTSKRAGGDYYDFFPFADDRCGMLIADVSGHGPPAAVYMAVTHTLAHTYPGQPDSPAAFLSYLNEHLATRYTATSDTFVTAFYAVFDPTTRTLTYSSAGHNPPRLKRCQDGSLALLDAAGGLPLGIAPGLSYGEHVHQLVPGDQLVLYTDGITEAHNPNGEMFGLERLDRVLENCSIGASDLLKSVLAAVDEFTAGRPADDDRTVLVCKIT